ncbi:ABC transporter substrate-binding protein [Streptomyces agglomeratus]|uniref:ABC transporter substrate-binding protein n=1 Tax=Streptomyces agglomeratus TaxID=285458 RepID=A0A1E5P201_9ACTN|nr:substrate-binding domain-containing protein [Streptomyces agglomeratus]OEJ23588.1 ABC transporter substrate-binding protein [Streptomyces agglomeratus]OEJ43181.1 ABC transporter substrate-binding protein [Streptomyces agglomeratus]OEJ54897.1 ABC transporter substrate-binding protein [Streptomyces agglomeratus]
MNALLRRTAVAAAASAMAMSLFGCGTNEEPNVRLSDDIVVGLLLPENQAARYEQFDKPVIEERIALQTNSKGRVRYANAKNDAELQTRQLESMIAEDVDVLIVDAVDSKAIAGAIEKADDAGIPVVAFDRLAEGPIDGYVSFDNEQVGHIQGKSLLKALSGEAGAGSGSGAASGKVVMINGALTDPNAAMFKKGAHTELDSKVEIGVEYDTKDWKPENAKANMQAAIAALGKDAITGVYSANDGMAGGIIDALKAAGVTDLPPVTGQDAELAAVQRIVAGDQYMTVYKQYAPEAEAAAEMAILLARHMSLGAAAHTDIDTPTEKSVPTVRIPVIAVTEDNIKETVVADGLYSVEQICIPKLKAECKQLGLV